MTLILLAFFCVLAAIPLVFAVVVLFKNLKYKKQRINKREDKKSA